MINNGLLYPWHKTTWDRIVAQKDRLPHAILLYGSVGTGKFDFAKHLSQSLLCDRPQHHQACQQCAKCLWFNEGHHPDFKLITPEESETSEELGKKKTTKKHAITVDQIRQLIQAISLSNHDSHALRIVLIHPAESLNSAAANALLKTLEAPPNNTIFILVTHQIQGLLPTIRSRCQAISMPLPNKTEAIAWLNLHLNTSATQQAEALLEYAGGAPLLALQASLDFDINQPLFKQLAMGAQLDAFSLAPLLLTNGMEKALTILQKWVYDILLSANALQLRYHLPYTKTLQALSKSVNLMLLLDFQRQLNAAKQVSNHPLNQEIQLEALLIQ